MSGWSDEGDGRRRAGTAGPARPQKPLPPGWNVRPRGMRQKPPRNFDVRDVRPREQRPRPAPPRDPGDGRGRAPKVGRRRGRRIGVTLLVLLVVLVGLAVWVDSRLNRVDALTDYDGRPAATPGADWLIVGSDSRQDLNEARRRELGTGQAAGRRADTMMLLHIPRGGGKPVLISLPRDSYVPIPGRGRNKLNAAYAFGGPKLLARTVEEVTGIRLDRYMEVGFDGFASVVDAVGGVQICPDRAMRDPMAGLNVKAGCQVVGSRQALAYVRTRAGGRGDLDRVERQQEFLGSLIDKATSPAVLLNPFRSVPLLLRGTEAVAVDQNAHVWNLIRFPFAMRDIAGGGGVATTVPVAGTATVSGAGSVVQWDRERALALFEALQRDQPVDGLVDQAER
ncbi:MAG TPA: LCP family protein [Actinomycetota bacterium]|nr:LCP family protein [Actinomycetota bacterium]